MNNELRKARLGYQKSLWTKAEVLAGLQHFYQINSRYPTAREIDHFEYLPSSRSIQRQFGGLVRLREELLPDSHSNYTKGAYRSTIAGETWHRAAQYEEEFYNFLVLHFEPIAIHEHKVMRPGNVTSDYFIYTSEENGTVIDLFYAKDFYSLAGVVNIKLRRYTALPFETIFVLVGNDSLSFDSVQSLLARRRLPLPSHISVDTEANFKSKTIQKLKEESIYSR